MTAHEQLIAFLATLFALVLVFIAALIASGAGVNVTEAFGIGTITGGLIGVLKIPSSRQVTVDNPPDKPVPTTDTPDPQPVDAAALAQRLKDQSNG